MNVDSTHPKIDDQFSVVNLTNIPDARGSLTFIENNKHVPFSIERVYYLHTIPSGAERAGHAHYNLKQLIIAISGAFTVNLDNGYERKSIFLSSPTEGLMISSMLWRTIDSFSSNAVCLVLASTIYDEADYIRNYDDFLAVARG